MSSKKDKSFIKYFEVGPYPEFWFGFTSSESAFQKELKRLNCLDHVEFTTKNATTHHLSKNDEVTYIVTIDLTGCKTLSGILGLLAHEAVHVWQGLLDYIGEKERPSSEIEAYHIQNISQAMFQEILKKYKVEKK